MQKYYFGLIMKHNLKILIILYNVITINNWIKFFKIFILLKFFFKIMQKF